MPIISSIVRQVGWLKKQGQMVDRQGASSIRSFLTHIEIDKHWIKEKIIIKNKNNKNNQCKTITIKDVKEVAKLLVLTNQFVITKIGCC